MSKKGDGGTNYPNFRAPWKPKKLRKRDKSQKPNTEKKLEIRTIYLCHKKAEEKGKERHT